MTDDHAVLPYKKSPELHAAAAGPHFNPLRKSSG